MMDTQSPTVRNAPIACAVFAILQILATYYFLLDVAELQAATIRVVHAQAAESSGERPALDIGLLVIGVACAAPVILAGTAWVRRWTLAYFLLWMVAAALAIGTVGGAAAFETYKFWRDYQPGDAIAQPASQR